MSSASNKHKDRELVVSAFQDLGHPLSTLTEYAIDTVLGQLHEKGTTVRKPQTIRQVILNSDLRALGTHSLPLETVHIDGPVLLQITAVLNLSAPSYSQQQPQTNGILGVKTTDGKRGLMLVEIEPIKEVSVRTPPGTKIQVKNATISQNRLILIEKGSEVVNLGGTVEELQQTWETNKRIKNKRSKAYDEDVSSNTNDASVLEENIDISRGPPQFVPFSEAIVRDAQKWMAERKKAAKSKSANQGVSASSGNTMNEVGAFARGISKETKRKMRELVVNPEDKVVDKNVETTTSVKPEFNVSSTGQFVRADSTKYDNRHHAGSSLEETFSNQAKADAPVARGSPASDVSRFFDHPPSKKTEGLDANMRLLAAMSMQTVHGGGDFDCTVVGLELESPEAQSNAYCLKFVLEDAAGENVVASPTNELEQKLCILGKYRNLNELAKSKNGPKEADKKIKELQRRFGIRRVRVTLMFMQNTTTLVNIESFNPRPAVEDEDNDILEHLTARPPVPPNSRGGQRGPRGSRGRGASRSSKGRGAPQNVNVLQTSTERGDYVNRSEDGMPRNEHSNKGPRGRGHVGAPSRESFPGRGRGGSARGRGDNGRGGTSRGRGSNAGPADSVKDGSSRQAETDEAKGGSSRGRGSNDRGGSSRGRGSNDRGGPSRGRVSNDRGGTARGRGGSDRGRGSNDRGGSSRGRGGNTRGRGDSSGSRGRGAGGNSGRGGNNQKGRGQ